MYYFRQDVVNVFNQSAIAREVGVAIETYKQIKTASQSQEYHGFM